MLAGKCPKCETSYYGWALRFPRHQVCPHCGVGLEISEDGRRLTKGYSPFTAEEHSVKPPLNAPADKTENPQVSKE